MKSELQTPELSAYGYFESIEALQKEIDRKRKGRESLFGHAVVIEGAKIIPQKNGQNLDPESFSCRSFNIQVGRDGTIDELLSE